MGAVSEDEQVAGLAVEVEDVRIGVDERVAAGTGEQESINICPLRISRPRSVKSRTA